MADQHGTKEGHGTPEQIDAVCNKHLEAMFKELKAANYCEICAVRTVLTSMIGTILFNTENEDTTMALTIETYYTAVQNHKANRLRVLNAESKLH